MEQSQLIELIKALKPEEKEHLLEFSNLSYFNKGRMRAQIGPLLDFCLNQPWHNPEHKLDKMEAYAMLFPKQPFVEGKLEKVMVDAQKVVRAFLLNQNYFREENEFYQVFDFTELLRRRGLLSRYRLSMARLKLLQEESPWRDVHYYHRQFQLETAVHFQESVENQRKGDLNIPNVLYSTEVYYNIRRFALLSRYLLQQMVTKLEPPDSIKNHLEDTQAPAPHLLDVPVLRIYYEIFLILKNGKPDTPDIQRVFDLLRLHESILDEETLHECFTHLRNLAVLVLSADLDREGICEILHELYIDNLSRGYLHFEGKIAPSRFCAVVINAILVKKIDWVQDFIEKYKGDIYGDNESQDIYRFVRAIYLFAIGEYSACLDILPSSSTHLDFLLLGKRLEIKAYYELGSDLLSFKLDAFKMYLSRTSVKILPETQRQTYVDFTNYLTQIMTSIPGDAKRAELVYKRIKENKKVSERSWLLAKALALKGRHAETKP